MKFKSVEEIKSAILPVAVGMNIEIVDVETKLSKSPSLWIYIDTENGVDLDTCEKFHNAIDSVLDDFDVSFGMPYTLNVSSPGIDRPFKTDSDFNKNIGKEVEIKLFSPLMGKKFLECLLVGYDGKNVILSDGNKEFKLPLTRIEKINQAIKF